MLATIAQSWHFVLSAQLALGLQPVVEQVLAGRDNLQLLQGDVLVALGLVVAVDLLQFLVQQDGKLCQIVWCLGELDEPLVTALRVGIHEHGGSRIFQHLGARLLAGIGQSLLGIVNDELLAKGVDEVLGAT